ncbi:MAG: MarR family transcriptional regulator [Dehalococcoidia bacterium]
MASTPETRDRIDALAMGLNSAGIHLVRRLRQADVVLGITPARLSALSVVVFGGPTTLAGLAAAEQVTPPTMTRLVAALEADGLVTRRPDLDDRRAITIEATPKGKRVMERGRRLRVERLTAQLNELPARDLETLERAVEVLRRLEE